MESNRKRGKKRHVEETLIDKGVNPHPGPQSQKDSTAVSETSESRKEMMIDIQNEENVDKALAKQNDKKCCGIVNNEKIRLYVITVSTFIFGFLSIAFGIFLLLTPQPQFRSPRGGIIAIFIGVFLFVPACYGITRIITKKIEKRKTKSSKASKEEPVGLTVSSLLDV